MSFHALYVAIVGIASAKLCCGSHGNFSAPQNQDWNRAEKRGALVDDVLIRGMKCAAHYPKGDGPFPVLVFIHGGGIPDSSGYSRAIHQMVSCGFVVVANMQDSMNGGIFGGAKYTNKIVKGLNFGMLRASAETRSIGLVGHSLGGVAVTSWAASKYTEESPEVKALVTFHGPKWSGSVAGIRLPILVVAGSEDWIAWPSMMLRFYNSCTSQQKVFIEIRGAGHTAVMDDHEDVGEARAAAFAFKAWLKADSIARQALYEGLAMDLNLTRYLHEPAHALGLHSLVSDILV